jgi:leucyl aminopeptidase (aminopeptidase T)
LVPTKINNDLLDSIEHLIFHCGSLKESENLCILCDTSTQNLAARFLSVVKSYSSSVNFHILPISDRHGIEPSEEVASDMMNSDLVISLCTYSLAHSDARIRAAKKGARFLSMPFYSEELLLDPAIRIDYRSIHPTAKKLANILSSAQTAVIKTSLGTHITIVLSGRTANCCPGFVENPGDLGSPPDIETNISPVENKSNGIVIVDGSVTCSEIGLLKQPIQLEIQNGRIVNIISSETEHTLFLNKIFKRCNSKRRILAEFGIGLNPLAKLTGTMLTDEGALGCFHFGFGSNHTVGGKNKTDFHLDFVFNNGSLTVDGQQIFDNGTLLIP